MCLCISNVRLKYSIHKAEADYRALDSTGGENKEGNISRTDKNLELSQGY